MSRVGAVICLVEPHLTVAHMAGPALQEGSNAGTGDAFAVFRQKQCAMARALDKSAGAIEELVGYPLQWNAAMGATVDIDISALTLAHHYQHHAVAAEPQAARVGQLVEPAQRCGRTFSKVIGHGLIIPAKVGQGEHRRALLAPDVSLRSSGDRLSALAVAGFPQRRVRIHP